MIWSFVNVFTKDYYNMPKTTVFLKTIHQKNFNLRYFQKGGFKSDTFQIYFLTRFLKISV